MTPSKQTYINFSCKVKFLHGIH